METASKCSVCGAAFHQKAPFYHLLWTELTYLGPRRNDVNSAVFCSIRCLIVWANVEAETTP